MITAHPIETKYGFLRGRDAIFLNDCKFINDISQLCLSGEINGRLASKSENLVTIEYQIIFPQILAVDIVELDMWESLYNHIPYSSCFDEITGSTYANYKDGKVSKEHKHYVFSTYDDVFSIFCAGFQLEFGKCY